MNEIRMRLQRGDFEILYCFCLTLYFHLARATTSARSHSQRPRTLRTDPSVFISTPTIDNVPERTAHATRTIKVPTRVTWRTIRQRSRECGSINTTSQSHPLLASSHSLVHFSHPSLPISRTSLRSSLSPTRIPPTLVTWPPPPRRGWP